MNKTKIAAGLSAAALVLAAPLVMHFEGVKADPYRDIGGVLTVCYGETHGVEMRRYAPAECRALLDKSLASHGADIAACMPPGLPDHVQAASLSFGYNVGASKFCASTMAAQLRRGNLPQACAELSKWTRVAGKDCRDPANRCAGIVRRRDAERTLCEGRA